MCGKQLVWIFLLSHSLKSTLGLLWIQSIRLFFPAALSAYIMNIRQNAPAEKDLFSDMLNSLAFRRKERKKYSRSFDAGHIAIYSLGKPAENLTNGMCYSKYKPHYNRAAVGRKNLLPIGPDRILIMSPVLRQPSMTTSPHQSRSIRHSRINHYPSTSALAEDKVSKRATITHFGIELNQPREHVYKPGEELLGRLILDVNQTLELKCVEFVVIGHATATFLSQTQSGSPGTRREIYLNKRAYPIGSFDSKWSLVIGAGYYTSKFRLKLPSDIPSTVFYENLQAGLILEISYFIKTCICDTLMEEPFALHNSRVILSKKKMFTVNQPINIDLISGSLLPIHHEEEAILTCSRSRHALVSLHLVQSVYMPGDTIRLYLGVKIQVGRTVSSILANLMQTVTLQDKTEHIHNCTSRVFSRNPKPMHTKLKEKSEEFQVVLPVPENSISTYLKGCHLFAVSYSVHVVIKFSGLSGKLTLQIPITIATKTWSQQDSAAVFGNSNIIPIFKSSLRYPYFTPSTRNNSWLLSKTRYTAAPEVTSKYTPWMTCFCC